MRSWFFFPHPGRRRAPWPCAQLSGKPWRPLQCGTGWRPAQPQARGSCPRAWPWQSSLELTESIVKRVLASSKSGDVLLLGAELISQAGGINHGLLGLLLSILGSNKHTVNLSLESVDAGLELALAGHVTAVDGLHVVDGTTSVRDVILELSDGTAGSIKKSLALLYLAREGGRLALRDADLLNNLGLGASLILESLDGLAELGLVSLDGLQTLRVSLVGVVQTNLKLVDLSLELLLDAEALTLGSLLSLYGGSEGLHGARVVLA